ncbi:hypothetical protein, partial [Terribacillus halophilus]|uniref:hypothetical protein n=1 Tax=Terribacillus halophilus TaxID=361279 RepID=UPI003982C2CA
KTKNSKGHSFWPMELDLAAAPDPLVSQRQRPSTPVLGTHEIYSMNVSYLVLKVYFKKSVAFSLRKCYNISCP